jgi:hypothetical protein
MSCSKIFSGDLPELTYGVLKYFKNDFSTLHSCILVNRLWCRLAIPLLWENPFSISTGNCKFIEIYLDNLKGDLKTKLNEYKVDDNLFSLNTLFNYSNFIKYLNTQDLVFSVEKWFIVAVNQPGNRYFLHDLNKASESNFRNLIHTSLLKIFIENEVNIHTLDIEIKNHSSYNSYLDDVLETILQNKNFIQNIRNLNHYINDYEESMVIKNHISQIINLQQNLRKILVTHKTLSLYQSLLLSNGSNCSNTLNTITLYRIDFENTINFGKIFEQLNVLESVHIVYCYSLNASFIQQIISLTKPIKLKSLLLNSRSQIDESIQLLLQQSGVYLENFGYDFGLRSNLKQQLLELFIKYFKNIKYLRLYRPKNEITYLTLSLIENIKHSLSYLSIGVGYLLITKDDIEFSSVILQNLGQILPSKLEYLNLSLFIKTNDFEVFLKNIQNTFIEKLTINNIDGQNILSYIKEYIMKNKSVKYLAIKNIIINNDLFSLEGEMKEFKSHGIEVRRYSELYIDPRKFIK